MKVLLIALFCVLPLNLALADGAGDAQKLTDVPVVSEEAMHDLFGRIRDAHSRAIQRGAVAMNTSMDTQKN